jgi:signal transduction histidine kinase
MLGEPDLRIERLEERRGADSGGSDDLVADDATGRRYVLLPGTGPVRDPATRDAIGRAVRLTVRNEDLRAEQDARLAELVESRRRLVEATDRQRERVAGELSSQVRPALDEARTRLLSARQRLESVGGRAAAAADAAVVDMLLAELLTVGDELDGMVAGVAPGSLGSGGLHSALVELARAQPISVRVEVDESAAAAPGVEATVYYLCAEAIANAVKHAVASTVTCRVVRAGDELVVTVTDDGRGGADSQGSGLLGLADRLAAAGGRFWVVTSPATGTTVGGTVPG